MNITWRWSKSLPGVAMSIFTPVASFWASTCRLTPPIIKPWVWEWYFSSSFTTPNVCIESSLVGEITITPVPFLGENLSLYISSTAGMRNAKVLPLPVFADTTASLNNKWEANKIIENRDRNKTTSILN